MYDIILYPILFELCYLAWPKHRAERKKEEYLNPFRSIFDDTHDYRKVSPVDGGHGPNFGWSKRF